MPTSGCPAGYSEYVLGLVWSLWTELGLSGWTRDHSHWVIDPEELLIFTAWLGDRDARLREECIDWCILFGDYLSNDRLKNLLSDADPETKRSFGEISATVRARKGPKLPSPTKARRGFLPSRKSTRPEIVRPAHLVLRMRKILGVGAKAEIVTRMILEPRRRFSINDLVSEGVAFARVTVAQALDDLAESGLVTVDRSRRDSQFQLLRSPLILEGLGAATGWRPPWRAVFALLKLGYQLLEHREASDPRVAELDGVELCKEIEAAVRELGVQIASGRDDDLDIGTPFSAGIGLLAGGGKGLVAGLLAGDSAWEPSRRAAIGRWLADFAAKLNEGELPIPRSPQRLDADEFLLYLQLREARGLRIATQGWCPEFGSDELLRMFAMKEIRSSDGRFEALAKQHGIEEALLDDYRACIEAAALKSSTAG